MVLEVLLNIVFASLTGLFSALPDISWDIDTGIIGTFLDFIGIVTYLFPMPVITSLIGLIVAINVFKIVISIIKTIWDLLPIL
jgi:hypothetical protein